MNNSVNQSENIDAVVAGLQDRQDSKVVVKMTGGIVAWTLIARNLHIVCDTSLYLIRLLHIRFRIDCIIEVLKELKVWRKNGRHTQENIAEEDDRQKSLLAQRDSVVVQEDADGNK